MSVKDSLKTWLINLLDLGDVSDTAYSNRAEQIARLEAYYGGDQPEQLKVKPGKFNDNLVVNLGKVIIDQAVSALVGDPADGAGVTWTFPSETGEEVPAHVEWLNNQWQANNQEIFLHRNALGGAKTGFPAIKLVPDGSGNIRLVNIKARLLTVEVDEQDEDKVEEYIIRYRVMEDNQTINYRETTVPNNSETGWIVTTERQRGAGRWEAVGPSVAWPYEFAPILAWQNLPCDYSVYGLGDLECVIPILDRYNFTISNISKLVRLYAHPNRYGKNLTAQMEDGGFKMGPDDLPLFYGDGEIAQLPTDSDLPAAIQYLSVLRELAFTVAREVDQAVFKDKVGAITNMGIRLMYKNALEKLGTKRMLYGNAYTELNRRMLILGGYPEEECIINWPNPLPENETEETTALQADLNMGIVSKQTVAEARGYDWTQEQERMNDEKANGDNAGSLLLQNFFKTGGTVPASPIPPEETIEENG
jgi:hypothetical protein